MSPSAGLGWMAQSIPVPSEKHRQQARQRQMELTKPPSSLGRLEPLAVQLAAMQASDCPRVDQVSIVLFAADHGVVAEGVSAFPQSVTASMIANFARSGGAISVLARQIGADLSVINLGTVTPLPRLQGVVDQTIAAGTANMVNQAAMESSQLNQAMNIGREQAAMAAEQGKQLFIGGEMGIGNTTAAAAIGAALLKCDAALLVGPGTGIDEGAVAHKVEVVQRALALHGDRLLSPLESLRRLGGFEIAALSGAIIGAAQQGLPFLVDGFIATSAALVATAINPDVAQWLLFGHRSAEPGHQRMLEGLNATPLLDLGMHLGEGSGAAAAVPILRLACALHNDMATFAEAGVAGQLASTDAGEHDHDC